jgi:hypothetical protein
MVFKERTPQSVFIALFSFALVPLLTLLTRTALLAPQALSWYISGTTDLSQNREWIGRAVLSDSRLRYVQYQGD